jgi:CubicO group peptidase (beta-lactamase class C family)
MIKFGSHQGAVMSQPTPPFPGFKRARRRIFGVLSVVLLCASPATAGDLDAVLASAMRGSDVPAMGVVMIVDGKVADEAVRGVRDGAGSQPVQLDDVWLIGSDAKAMTATMISCLVERGVLDWNTPLAKMLPDLAQTMNPQYRAATLVQLLSHRTGLPPGLSGDDAAVAKEIAATHGLSLSGQRLSYIAKQLQDAPVGPATDFNYSNIGYMVAAVIAERATGVSFEELMRKYVYAPLDMDHVGFGSPQTGQNIGHTQGRPATQADDVPDFAAPVGSVFMPLGDWALFCLDQLRGAKGHGKLLKPATYAVMQSGQPGHYDGMPPGAAYGLGWGLRPSFAHRKGPALAHSGSDGNWLAQVVLFPQTGAGVLVTANAGNAGANKAEAAVVDTLVVRLAPPMPGDPPAK